MFFPESVQNKYVKTRTTEWSINVKVRIKAENWIRPRLFGLFTCGVVCWILFQWWIKNVQQTSTYIDFRWCWPLCTTFLNCYRNFASMSATLVYENNVFFLSSIWFFILRINGTIARINTPEKAWKSVLISFYTAGSDWTTYFKNDWSTLSRLAHW